MVKKAKNDAVLEVPVEFGGVSIGQLTARLGVRISRAVLNIVAADEALCGHRLTGVVVLGQRDDTPGQTKAFDTDYEVEATFDVKRIGVSADTITTGLTFNLADIDIAELAKFSKGTGRLIVNTVSEIPEDAPDEHDEGDEGKGRHLPGTLVCNGPWRDYPLKKLFEGALLKSLTEAGLTTVGKLSDYTMGDKRLTDLAGVGPGKAQKIEDTMLEFWSQNEGLNQAE